MGWMDRRYSWITHGWFSMDGWMDGWTLLMDGSPAVLNGIASDLY